jgi:thioredoxin reductase (NADPH)
METFQVFADRYGYLALFLGVLLENAGVPVPGETAVLVSGFLASPAGGGHFSILWVIVITLTAAVIGDNLGFWLGHRWARPRLQQGRGFLFLTPKTLQLAESYFDRYGIWTIFFARFITGLRVVGALAAGTAGMAWPRFLVANAGGALAWATTMSLLGYFCGHSWELLHKWLGRGGLIILGCVIVLVGLPYLWRRLRKLSPALLHRIARAQVWHGILAAILEAVCIAMLLQLAKGGPTSAVDRAVAEWVKGHETPALETLAKVGTLPGTLPVAAALTLLMVAFLWHRQRSWRESAVMVWALLASEGVGLVLWGLLRSHAIEAVKSEVWPFGFAGLIPLRAFAVLGMGAVLLTRQSRTWGRVALALAAVLVLLVGCCVILTQQQRFHETLLEFAAGAIIVFAGLWWLEGYGPGLFSPRGEQVSVRSSENESVVHSPQQRTTDYGIGCWSDCMPEKVVIIGSGPAGWTAAIYAARANLQPLVFEGAITQENQIRGTLPLGQLALTTEVENYPGLPEGDSREYLRTALPPDRQPFWVQKNRPQPSRGINGPEMMELMRQQAVNFGTRVITDDIVRVDFKRHPFLLYSLGGQTIECLALIIATGARANYLGLPSEERFKNLGVSACAVCDGALPRFRNKPLVVVGGGDSAVEESTYLSKFASVVYLVHRRDELRASKIMQQRALTNPKIVMKWNRVVQEVLGNDKDGVTGVRLNSTVDAATEEVACSGLFLAIGHTPNTDFLRGQVELTEAGYVRWTKPQRTYTSVEGVFAAGDVADSYYRQAVTAAGTGCMAALDAERWLAARGSH